MLCGQLADTMAGVPSQPVKAAFMAATNFSPSLAARLNGTCMG